MTQISYRYTSPVSVHVSFTSLHVLRLISKIGIFFYKIKHVKPYHKWLFRANKACKLAIFDIRWTKDICATRNLSESQLSHRASTCFPIGMPSGCSSIQTKSEP